jgi:hypothetical protein
MTHLDPTGDATALGDQTILRFGAVPTANRYSVTVEDERGTIVFQTETARSSVVLPPLEPGRRYHWSVRAVDTGGYALRGDGDFSTLPGDLAKARATFLGAVDSHDPNALALAGEMDRRLRLLKQAREEFAMAIALGARASDLEKILADLDRQLALAGPIGLPKN